MLTLNIRQLRALSIVAPGTLAVRSDSTFALTTFMLSVEDADRCGYHALTVNQDGDVAHHYNADRNDSLAGTVKWTSYGTIRANDSADRLEAAELVGLA